MTRSHSGHTHAVMSSPSGEQGTRQSGQFGGPSPSSSMVMMVPTTSRDQSTVTLMTAGLVIIIWGLAGPALSQVFEQAIDRVTAF
jgi:hypothetical protein